MNPDGGKLTMKRAERIKKFVSRHLLGKAEIALDCGMSNPVGDHIAETLDLELINTVGDLDFNYTALKRKYDVVFCFEILEHLMAPKYFLKTLSPIITEKTQIFISYPSRPKFLWTEFHFHEYDKKRFEYLMKECGYRIIAWERVRAPFSFKSCVLGIRPFLRQAGKYKNLIYAKKESEKHTIDINTNGCFMCGPPKCDCDDNGPGILLMNDAPYEAEDTPENREKYKDQINGGSISCSKCGKSAFGRALWDLP